MYIYIQLLYLAMTEVFVSNNTCFNAFDASIALNYIFSAPYDGQYGKTMTSVLISVCFCLFLFFCGYETCDT